MSDAIAINTFCGLPIGVITDPIVNENAKSMNINCRGNPDALAM